MYSARGGIPGGRPRRADYRRVRPVRIAADLSAGGTPGRRERQGEEGEARRAVAIPLGLCELRRKRDSSDSCPELRLELFHLVVTRSTSRRVAFLLVALRLLRRSGY